MKTLEPRAYTSEATADTNLPNPRAEKAATTSTANQLETSLPRRVWFALTLQ